MPSKRKAPRKLNLRLAAMIGGGAILIVAISVGVTLFILQQYTTNARQAGIVSIRELIIRAADSTKINAPVDAKTGDIYFPEAKLYVPNDARYTQFTYAYDSPDKDLTISTRSIFSQASAKLYTVKNINDLFDNVPHLQACQRGVHLVYHDLGPGTDLALDRTVQLNNKQILYFYTEKGCPELSSIVPMLKDIQAY
jgi:hypothetical protein